jgi:hypothetical protein
MEESMPYVVSIFSLIACVFVFPFQGLSQEEVTIYEIQKGLVPPGTEVITNGVVTADHMVYQHDTFEYAVIQDPQAGPWSGIVLFSTAQGVLVCDEGDEVRIQGTVDEYYDMTELRNITSFEKLGTSPVPAAEILTTGDLCNDNPEEAEKWESVLVVVFDAEITDDGFGYGEFEIDDGSGAARVDDWSGGIFKPYTYEPVLGDIIDVRGILWYSYEYFKLEPRGDEDIPEVVLTDLVLDILYSRPWARPGDTVPWKVALINRTDVDVNIDRMRLDVTGPFALTRLLWSGFGTLKPSRRFEVWFELTVHPKAPLGVYTCATVAEYDGEDLASDSFECELVE